MQLSLSELKAMMGWSPLQQAKHLFQRSPWVEEHWERLCLWSWGPRTHSDGGQAMLPCTVSTHTLWDKKEQQKTRSLSPRLSVSHT